MIKEDEISLWKNIWKEIKQGNKPYFREIAEKLNINEKRTYYILNKWNTKGLTNSGISPFAGWFEDDIKEDDFK